LLLVRIAPDQKSQHANGGEGHDADEDVLLRDFHNFRPKKCGVARYAYSMDARGSGALEYGLRTGAVVHSIPALVRGAAA